MTTPLHKTCSNDSCPLTSEVDPSTLQLCSRCRLVAYCSKECQRASWPSHKPSCRAQNYILRVQLHPSEILSPPVERTLSCPAHLPFYALHMALQTAFGWATTHSFDFAVPDPEYKPPQDMMQHMMMLMKRHGNSSKGGMAGEDDPREYELRVVDPVEQTMFSGIDRMHEGQRKHPRTVEKRADKYALYQFFEDGRWKGEFVPFSSSFSFLILVSSKGPGDIHRGFTLLSECLSFHISLSQLCSLLTPVCFRTLSIFLPFFPFPFPT